MMYVQCQLRKENMERISWIPEKDAQIGKVISIKEDGKWTDGWNVRATYGKLSEEKVIAGRDSYRHHRKNTDA